MEGQTAFTCFKIIHVIKVKVVLTPTSTSDTVLTPTLTSKATKLRTRGKVAEKIQLYIRHFPGVSACVRECVRARASVL